MSAISGNSSAGSGILSFFKDLTPQAQQAAEKTAENAAAKLKAAKEGKQDTSAASGNPIDTIETSPQATVALSNLSILSSQKSAAQKDQDAKDLKAATDKLHLLEVLGGSLSPEKLAKEVTDLAKQISGLAADYAANSGSPGSTPSAPSAASTATSTADNAANAAKTSASADKTATDATNSAKTAKQSADAAAQTASSAKAAADAATKSASGATSAEGDQASPSATPSGSVADANSIAPNGESAADTSQADTAGFFSQVVGDFKELKKLETSALSRLSISQDPKKKDEAKKLGSEFNDAVDSVKQSAAAVGYTNSDLNKLSINVAQVTFSITA